MPSDESPRCSKSGVTSQLTKSTRGSSAHVIDHAARLRYELRAAVRDDLRR